MPSVRTLGLVVRVVDVFETSLVVTLFTRELGKIGALAKGARRLKSPLQGGLDLLGVSDIVVPYDDNTGLLKERYQAGGGSITVKIIPGEGHKVSPSFFECRELVDFVIANIAN